MHSFRHNLFLVCLGIFSSTVLLLTSPAPVTHAATINVPCDVSALIEAINTANADGAADTLELASDCVYTLVAVNNSTPDPNGLPVITADLTINGNGSTIERSSAHGIPSFRIMQGDLGVSLQVRDITLQNGCSIAGAAIYNRGSLALDNAAFLNNVAHADQEGGGGAIYNSLGTMTITDSTFTNNRQEGGGDLNVGGGAIWSQGDATITNSQFNGNISENASTESWNGGGAMYLAGGNISIAGSAFSNNNAISSGGAIANNGDLEVSESVFTSNSVSGPFAPGASGGISNFGVLSVKDSTFTLNDRGAITSVSTLTLVGSTFSNNTRGTFGNSGTAEISDCQFIGNTGSSGPAIGNIGTLTVRHSEFAENTADIYGGALYNAALGDLRVSDSSFHDNSASWGGGLMSEGQAVIARSVFTNNQATSYGGGVMNYRGKMHVKRSTFTGNQAGERGGGIASFTIQGYPVNMTLDTSTIENNDAKAGGGAYISGASAYWFYKLESNINNSTFANNHATGAHGQGGGLYATGKIKIGNTTFSGNITDEFGGGIYNSSRLTLFNVTLAKNSAQQGGALYQYVGRSRLINTILAKSAPGANCAIYTGKIEDGGHNLATDDSCGIPATPKIRLDKNGLQDNGGPTRTIALRPKSPAVDAGDDVVCANAIIKASDQRGVKRPQGTHCDIGAYELKP